MKTAGGAPCAQHPTFDQSEHIIRQKYPEIHDKIYIFYYINGPHKQYILLDIIFNYNFHFGLPGKYLYNCSEIILRYHGASPVVIQVDF